MQQISSRMLKDTDIFKNLNEAQLRKLEAIASIKKYPATTVLFKKGDIASNFYIVGKGRVLLQTQVDIGTGRPPLVLDLTTVGAGHSIGWSVFAEPFRYSASCRCIEDTSMISFNADLLKSLLDGDPGLGYEVLKGIIKILASRLDNTRELLLDEQVLARLRAKGETLL